MRFFVHGKSLEAINKALIKQGHHVHLPAELEAEGEPTADLASPADLLPRLATKQWHLLTTDGDFIRKMYEEKVEFPAGIIVNILDEAATAEAVDRLFERYKRLTPKRMYTITPSRVKIRQLPGLPG